MNTNKIFKIMTYLIFPVTFAIVCENPLILFVLNVELDTQNHIINCGVIDTMPEILINYTHLPSNNISCIKYLVNLILLT